MTICVTLADASTFAVFSLFAAEPGLTQESLCLPVPPIGLVGFTPGVLTKHKEKLKMGKRLLFLAMALAPLLTNGAETPAAEKLPVRRVVLYKNGVGYFEHNGRVRGSQELRIDFTSTQLNDVLKSLTVLDLNGGKISGVGYNSVAPITEQLKALRLPLGEATTLAG